MPCARPTIDVAILRKFDMRDPLLDLVVVGVKATRDGVALAWVGPEIEVNRSAKDPFAALNKAVAGAIAVMLNDPHTASFMKEG